MFLVAALAATMAAADPTAALGTIQVGRGVTEPVVWLILKQDGVSLRLAGEATAELSRLQSTIVEVLGMRSEQSFVAQAYRIIQLPGGTRPTAVGIVVGNAQTGLAIATDGGAPVALSAAPKLRAALGGLIGAKLWIVGEKLLSGEIKVTRYGVLHERLQKAPDDAAAPAPAAADQ